MLDSKRWSPPIDEEPLEPAAAADLVGEVVESDFTLWERAGAGVTTVIGLVTGTDSTGTGLTTPLAAGVPVERASSLFLVSVRVSIVGRSLDLAASTEPGTDRPGLGAGRWMSRCPCLCCFKF
jgi:hypothetical protein